VPPSVRARRFAGVAAILAAAALWGSTGTVAHVAPPGASPVSIGAARIVVGGALLVLIALWPGRTGPDTPGRLLRQPGWQRASLGAAAVAVAGYQICFFSAVHLTGVAVGTMVAIGSGPVFAGVISMLTGGARPTARWAIATCGAIAGCSVLLAGGRTAGVVVTGAGLALLAGLCYASYAVTAARLIAGGLSERSVMAVIFGGGAVLLLPVLIATDPGWLLTWRGAAVVFELAVLATAAAYLLYGYGLRTVPAPVAVTLGLAEPVVAALLAVVVLGERLTGIEIAGLLLVGCALAILAVPPPSSV
jgi:drug/metabolite transporter, DME family